MQDAPGLKLYLTPRFGYAHSNGFYMAFASPLPGGRSMRVFQFQVAPYITLNQIRVPWQTLPTVLVHI